MWNICDFSCEEDLIKNQQKNDKKVNVQRFETKTRGYMYIWQSKGRE